MPTALTKKQEAVMRTRAYALRIEMQTLTRVIDAAERSPQWPHEIATQSRRVLKAAVSMDAFVHRWRRHR